jgi:uncharacterized membrane protein
MFNLYFCYNILNVGIYYPQPVITLLYVLGLGEEAVTVIDDLTHTLMDVHLKVTTKRSNHEEEALHQVNRLIDHLVSKVHEGPNTKELCHVYIRSCYKSGKDISQLILNIRVIVIVMCFNRFLKDNAQKKPLRTTMSIRFNP